MLTTRLKTTTNKDEFQDSFYFIIIMVMVVGGGGYTVTEIPSLWSIREAYVHASSSVDIAARTDLNEPTNPVGHTEAEMLLLGKVLEQGTRRSSWTPSLMKLWSMEPRVFVSHLWDP